MRDGEVSSRPLVNLPGCPPIPEAIAAVLLHYLVFEDFPELDELRRPRVFYGATVHEHCGRYHHFVEGRFAERFDGEGARRGWCLLRLGCRGPLTHNACPTLRWNQQTAYPIEAGHPCLGCSEPGFWDRGGFYRALRTETAPEEAQATPAERGAAIFDDNCVFCHLPSRQPFRTRAEEVPTLLARSNIGAHRFSFSEAELADLAQYLKTLEKAP
jgi:hydrogenase small subunit